MYYLFAGILSFGLLTGMIGGCTYKALELERYKAQVATEKQSLQEAYTNQMTEQFVDINNLNAEIQQLDSHYTDALSEQIKENNDLRSDLGNLVSMRFEGAVCEAPASASNQETASSSVGDEATVGLTEKARQDVLNLREEIIKDQNKIRYLQEYIRTELNEKPLD